MQAMEVVAKAAGNDVVTTAVLKARASIREGESISGPLGESGIFPPMVTQMIAVGEETGKLDGMLQKISDFYDLEVETTLSALTSVLEPLLMIGMGFVVGFIVISMFMPMFKLIGAIK
jgi:type IV pilus assembly protein PilC